MQKMTHKTQKCSFFDTDLQQNIEVSEPSGMTGNAYILEFSRTSKVALVFPKLIDFWEIECRFLFYKGE